MQILKKNITRLLKIVWIESTDKKMVIIQM